MFHIRVAVRSDSVKVVPHCLPHFFVAFFCKAKLVIITHDVCRAGMRNMRKRGCSEREVMLLAGRKTAEVIRKHYDTMQEEDAFEAAKKLTGSQTSKVLAK